MCIAHVETNSFVWLLGGARFGGAVILVAVMGLTLLAVYLTYGERNMKQSFFARDINDATYDCEDKIDAKFKKRLVSKYYDEISSRYEANKNQYVIYYRVSARDIEGEYPMVTDYMAKCIVWEKLGYVSDFQVFDI